MISSELTLNHSALIKNMINNIYLSRDQKVFYTIEPNTIKSILKSLLIVVIAHAFLIYILYMLYKNIYLYVVERPYVLSINKWLTIEAHAHTFLLTGVSPDQLGDTLPWKAVRTRAHCRKSRGCNKHGPCKCESVWAKPCLGSWASPTVRLWDGIHAGGCPRATMWSAARSGTQAKRPAHVKIYLHQWTFMVLFYSLFTLFAHGEYLVEEVERKMEFGCLNRKGELSITASSLGDCTKMGCEDKTT